MSSALLVVALATTVLTPTLIMLERWQLQSPLIVEAGESPRSN
ncbi:MAG TPA: hypothetical protein VIL28_07400 [Steroidobacteraceae bacterium]